MASQLVAELFGEQAEMDEFTAQYRRQVYSSNSAGGEQYFVFQQHLTSTSTLGSMTYFDCVIVFLTTLLVGSILLQAVYQCNHKQGLYTLWYENRKRAKHENKEEIELSSYIKYYNI